jgi:coagulation factor 5/8 type domain protein
MRYLNYLLLVFTLIACTRSGWVIVSPSHSYKVVLPEDATTKEKKAAVVLRDYLKKISGKELQISSANQIESKGNIVICSEGRDKFTGNKVLGLGDDGFHIYTDKGNLYIVGGTGDGVIYGVYSFLEEYLNCRMYTADVQIIPKKETLLIPEHIDNRQVPILKHRYLGYRGMGVGEYALWNKLSPPLGTVESHWGLFAESFGRLLLPDKYYKEHPEYYAYYNGKRVPSQLCLSNPDVLKLVVADLRKRMAAKPDAIYWSVSQNDNVGYCHCDKCAAIDKEEGNPSGSIIRFVNQVAEQFPDKMISTLAYTYSRGAPTKTKPANNVNIMFCNIECNRSCPLENDSISASFRKDITDWSKIAKNIFVWDYVIQFKNLVSPFPNLRTLQPNLEYFVKHGVTGIFEQGNREVGGEFCELRSYLLSKLMWNPSLNADSIIADFTNGYYGKGGVYIKEYIDLLHNNLEKSGDRLSIFGNTLDPKKSYLSPECIRQYGALFDRAEISEQDHPAVLQRIKTARLPLTYVEIEQARVNPLGEGSLFKKENGVYVLNDSFINKINDFIACCKKQGITRLSEWHTTPDEYLEIIKSYTDMNFNGNKALGKRYVIIPNLSVENRKAAPDVLTDGLYGTNEYSSMWLRANEKVYEVIMDMDTLTSVSNVAAHFMNNNSSSVFLPAKVEFYISEDGSNYQKIGEQKGPAVVNTNGPAGSYASGTKPIPLFYKVANVDKMARWVKIKVTSIGDCPVWHPDVGAPALTMIDEIVIQ